MTVEIEMHGGCCYTVQGSYDEIVHRHWVTLTAEKHGDGDGTYEVTLGDGMYGPHGTAVRMLVNPHSVATIRDLDGYAPETKT